MQRCDSVKQGGSVMPTYREHDVVERWKLSAAWCF